MNSTTERWRAQSERMCAWVSSRPAGMMPWRVAESCIACSESAKVVSRSETDPSRNVSSAAAPGESPLDRSHRAVAGLGLVAGGLVRRGLEVALEVGRVAELAELGRRGPEEEAGRPGEPPGRPPGPARHQQQVVGPGGEPRGEAAQLHAEHRGHRLVAAEVDEYAERL